AVHRLVQQVVRDSLPAEGQRQWMLYAIDVVNQAFPDVEFTHWAECERCLPHALLCAQWVKQEQIVTPGAMRLLDQLGYYLTVRGHYGEAGPFLQQALSLREQELGAEHLDIALSMYHLGLLCERQSKDV